MRFRAKNYRRTLQAQSDALWQQLIIGLYGNKCVVCVKEGLYKGQQPVTGHHLIRRCWGWFRHDLLNGIAVCNEHHRWGDSKRKEVEAWLMENMSDVYYHLVANKQSPHYREGGRIPTYHLKEVRDSLRARLKEWGLDY